MKKVMMVTALAALAAGAMAEDVVPSGNIVGYAKLKLEYSKNFLGVMLKDISRGGVAVTDMHIQSIGTDAPDDGSTIISWWDGLSFYNQALWLDGMWRDWGEVPVEKTFSVGEGFMFEGSSGDTTLLAGELCTQSTTNTSIGLSAQYSKGFMVNPMPTPLNIQDIYAEADDDGSIIISWWNGLSFYNQALWLDGMWRDWGEDPIVKTFAIGEAFILEAGSGDMFNFPNPLAP